MTQGAYYEYKFYFTDEEVKALAIQITSQHYTGSKQQTWQLRKAVWF